MEDWCPLTQSSQRYSLLNDFWASNKLHNTYKHIPGFSKISCKLHQMHMTYFFTRPLWRLTHLQLWGLVGSASPFIFAFYPQGVVELYSKIADQGYTIMFLTNRLNTSPKTFPQISTLSDNWQCCRAIGQSEMTADYIRSLKEGSYKMPRGPVLLQVSFTCLQIPGCR